MRFLQTRPAHKSVTWFVVIVLLLLRIPYSLAIIYFLPIENQNEAAIYEVGTYLLTAFLIWWERDDLSEYHLDFAAILLILFLRPIQTFILAYWGIDTPMVFPGIPSQIILGTSILLGISLWHSGYKPSQTTKSTFYWIIIGIVIGILISIAENFPAFKSTLSSGHPVPTAVLLSTSINLFYHLGFAPINEEPLFRGFLWGLLRQAKWKDGWILAFQTILFTSAHVYFAQQYPLMFWVLIPMAAIIFGVLTLRSRSISSANFAHGLINGSVYVLLAGLLSHLSN